MEFNERHGFYGVDGLEESFRAIPFGITNTVLSGYWIPIGPISGVSLV